MGSVTEQKVDAERVRNMASAMSEIVDRVKRMQEQLVENSLRTETVSVKVERTSERISDPMVDVSPWQVANFFYTVEVSLNQTTAMVGYMPATAKVRAVDAKPKWKAKEKAPAGGAGTLKAASAPSSPLKTEGPAPPKQSVKQRLHRPLTIAPELLAHYDKHAAAKRAAKKGAFSTQMLMLNAIEQVDSKCYRLLDSGRSALVLPKVDSMQGIEDHHAVAIEGASPLMPLTRLVLLADWSDIPTAKDGRTQVEVQSPQGAKVQLTERSKMHYLDQGAFTQVLQDVWQNCSLMRGMSQAHLTSVLSH